MSHADGGPPSPAHPGGGRWRRPMAARDPHEPHRAATPLELLFDLCFVVAVAQAAAGLHHGVAAGHAGSSVLGYAMVFFAIWWAWMNFTWFASAYDTDDVPYRVTALVQIAGVLVLAAGVPRGLEGRDFGVITLGYGVMRVGLIIQWLRAWRSDPRRRRTTMRFAVGVGVCYAGWVALLLIPPEWRLVGWGVMVAAELMVPIWAEHAGSTSWHPHHIAERYGLMTLIVIGESVLSATIAIQTALDAHGATGDLIVVMIGGLLILFSMWWLYFDHQAARFLVSNRAGFVWGYGHLLIFSSAAAVGAGLAAVVDHAAGKAHISYRAAGAAIAVPVAIYLMSVWLMHLRPHQVGLLQRAAVPAVAALVLVAAAFDGPVLVIGFLLAGLVAFSVVTGRPSHAQ
jgi:low temperature requirement protein LtrA